ncbi:unnamed protein product [Linum grandiflorum]
MEVRTSMIHIINIITIFMWSLLISTCHTAPLSFNFSNFEKCSDSIKLVATAACGNSAVQLTSADYYISGQAQYYKPMRLWEASTGKLTNFTTTFTFSMDNYNGSFRCDGLAFFIASSNFISPAGNASYGRLGLVDGENSSNTQGNQFVAVEFDTYYNSDWDTLSDIHVGIDINSVQSVASKRWRSYSNGTIMSANVSYKTKNLCVEFMGIKESTEIGKEETEVDVPGDTLCYELDLRDYLTEWTVFGFSASTAFRYQSHELKSWSFSSDLDSKSGSSIVKSEVNKSNTTQTRKNEGGKTNKNNTTQIGKDEGQKANKSLITGLSVGIIGGLAILILVGTAIRARSTKKPGPNLHSDSGRRSPEGFLTARRDRSTR